MNEERAIKLIASLDDSGWQSVMTTGELVLDGTYSPAQVEAIGWWFQRHKHWPGKSKREGPEFGERQVL
jgi:hypothetical protein